MDTIYEKASEAIDRLLATNPGQFLTLEVQLSLHKSKHDSKIAYEFPVNQEPRDTMLWLEHLIKERVSELIDHLYFVKTDGNVGEEEEDGIN